MKKIAIIAPYAAFNHTTYYDSISDTFKGYSISMFVPHNYKTDESKYNVTRIEEGENIFLFFRRIIKDVNTHDLVVFEELNSKLLFLFLFLIRITPKKLFTIHNCNLWLSPIILLSFNSIINLILKKLIFRIFDGYIAISYNTKNYLSSVLNSSKPVFYIPFNNLKVTRETIIERNEELVITIPGGIDITRRNYSEVLDAYEFVLEKIPSARLIFLGRLVNVNDDFMNKIQNLKSLYNVTVKYWDSYISNDEFDKYLIKSTFFIGNINFIYKTNKNIELYGITKETGIPFLSLMYKKISFVPSYYLIPNGLSSLFIQYSDAETLANLILNNFNHFKKNENIDLSEYYNIIATESSIINKWLK